VNPSAVLPLFENPYILLLSIVSIEQKYDKDKIFYFIFSTQIMIFSTQIS